MRAGAAPPVAAVIITDALDMAPVLAAVVGLTPRQLRELVRERGIRHTTRSRHVYVRVDDVLRALDLADDVEPARADESESWDRQGVIQLAARRGSK